MVIKISSSLERSIYYGFPVVYHRTKASIFEEDKQDSSSKASQIGFLWKNLKVLADGLGRNLPTISFFLAFLLAFLDVNHHSKSNIFEVNK